MGHRGCYFCAIFWSKGHVTYFILSVLLNITPGRQAVLFLLHSESTTTNYCSFSWIIWSNVELMSLKLTIKTKRTPRMNVLMFYFILLLRCCSWLGDYKGSIQNYSLFWFSKARFLWLALIYTVGKTIQTWMKWMT